MKRWGMHFEGLVCLVLAVFAAALLYACGGGGTGDTGTVALYATDNPSLNTEVTPTVDDSGNGTDDSLDSDVTPTVNGNGTGDLSLFTELTATINKIELVNTGHGTACEVLSGPTSLDMADLSDVMHLIAVAECPAASYNRIRVEFDKDIGLADGEENESSCSFASHKGMGNQPNVLHCEGDGCTLEINGAVNVFMKQNNPMALNFNLKEFEVKGFGDPEACSVTMKVSPLHGSEVEMELPGTLESITGLVSNLSTTDQTFDLIRGGRTFPVLYSDITSSQQPGIDELLRKAQDEGLRVKVLSSQIDVAGGEIEATAIFVMVEGVVSNADAENQTFSLVYSGGSATIAVDYAGGAVDAEPADGDTAKLKLLGFDGEWYLAAEVNTGSGDSTSGN
jgi:hypothetical protein